MTNAVIQVRVPKEMKEQAEAVLDAIGMKTSEAVRVFLQQCINSHGLPFQPQVKVPNAETLKAFAEMDAGEGERMTFDEFYKEFGFDDD